MVGLRSDNHFYFLNLETTGDADGRCMKDAERQASAANAWNTTAHAMKALAHSQSHHGHLSHGVRMIRDLHHLHCKQEVINT